MKIKTRSFILGGITGLLAFNLSYIIMLFMVYKGYMTTKEISIGLFQMPILLIIILISYWYISKHYDLKRKNE